MKIGSYQHTNRPIPIIGASLDRIMHERQIYWQCLLQILYKVISVE